MQSHFFCPKYYRSLVVRSLICWQAKIGSDEKISLTNRLVA
ncbi:hypothetical protein COO91_01780 [Nostoc flagelliforme CCNUN1]|uniref:Uncharacterized protein n=1 Tax=Nostoc flagelliforme CCNUN1 TaxID=2038116 RepID=A0A2K8SKE6_9NOSO|nr:hypothetical protein COO91_01780 [Nostoc flagelliforme CCNUN1]